MTRELKVGQIYTFGTDSDTERGTVAAIDGNLVTVQWEQGTVTTQRRDALTLAVREEN